MAVTVTVATKDDITALQAFGASLDEGGTAWRSALSVPAPDAETLARIYAAFTILIAKDGGTITGWMAYRQEDAVIKWLVATPTANVFRPAVAAMLRAIITTTGLLPRGRVYNPAHKDRLAAMGFTVSATEDGSWWVIFPEAMR